MPVGAVVPFVGTTMPTNMLLCNGAAVSRTTYSTLFNVIGTAFGAGDGSTTFNLPDFRTATRIPIGKTSATTAINAVGKSGGSFNHTHTSTAHAHAFSHSHDLGNHTHAYDHTHTMGNHTHTYSHNHSLGNHYHIWYAHGHSIAGTNGAGGGHSHSIGTNPSAGAAGTSGGRPSNSGTRSATLTSSTHAETIWLTNSVGTGGTDMSVSNMASGSPRWNDGVTNRDFTTTNNPGTGAPSTNSTGSATGSTGAPSSNVTSTYSGNTDSATPGNTTSANPPYVTVNFIIQVA